jgi:hypothetical protein
MKRECVGPCTCAIAGKHLNQDVADEVHGPLASRQGLPRAGHEALNATLVVTVRLGGVAVIARPDEVEIAPIDASAVSINDGRDLMFDYHAVYIGCQSDSVSVRLG